MPWNRIADEWGDEVTDALRAARLDAEPFLELYDYLAENEVATLDRIVRDLGLPADVSRQYLRILMEHEDVYASFVETRGRSAIHYCYAPEMLAQLCRRRKISLARFLKLRSVLDPFMQKVEDYYVSRALEARTKGAKVSGLKRRYVKLIQPLVSPETPLTSKKVRGRWVKGWPHPITTHPAWRYLRAAQDLVLLKLDIPRPFVDHLKDDIGEPDRQLGRGEEWARVLERSKDVVIIECIDCRGPRVVSTKDAFQVVRCEPCQEAYRRSRFAGRKRLGRDSPSRRVGGGKEVKSTAPEKKSDLIAIKCAYKGCGATRMIHPQDRFQVKFCVEHQKQHRLDMAKARRAARSKGKKAAKPRTSKKALRAPLPKSEPPAKAEPEPAAEPAPAAEPSATS